MNARVFPNLSATMVGQFNSGSGEGGSEVVSHHNGRLYVTNGEEDRIDVFDVAQNQLVTSIDLTQLPGYDGLNSVAVTDAGLAVAIERAPAELPSPSMLAGENGWTSEAVFTVGASLDNGYTPPGVLDGIGAIALNQDTVRVFVNHELGAGDGYAFDVDGIELTGARISFFDIDVTTRSIVDGGPAITAIFDAAGNRATDTSFTFEDRPGFDRFCSGSLFEADSFGEGRGLVNNLYFAGEETGGNFSGVGGAEWALDVETGSLYALPAFGRGAWENVTELDTGTTTHVAFLLADDTSPFDANGDSEDEGAPVYLYVGEKDAQGDFLAQNGLSGGTLYVWVGDNADSPAGFNGTGSTMNGNWVEIENLPNGTPSEDGSTGFDEFGYPTQSTLWTRAHDLGAFQMSRPEDVATNPNDGSQAVFASTGRAGAFDDADAAGTVYIFDVDFTDINAPTANAQILYDGDDDATQALRSPDNLDWADNGLIYVQEDRANGDLFGEGAVNPNDASIVQIDPATGAVTRVAHVDQSVHLPFGAVEENLAGSGQLDIGDWESSGILDVSTLFGEAPGTLFLADVQAHGLDDQERFGVDGPAAQLTDDNLREGGQLVFLAAPGVTAGVQNPIDPVYNTNGAVALYDLDDLSAAPRVFEAGNLPDMVTFSQDGTRIFVANEGEPTEHGNPAGSISVIDLESGAVQSFGFEQFDDQVDALRDAGVRIFPDRLPSRDFEPEYIAEGADGNLYVTLQEANAVGVFNLESMSWSAILPLGTVDHSQPGFGLDASDRDDAIDIRNWDVRGLRMPDAIATAEIGGQTYFLTANEGDDRGDFDEGGDAARVGDILDGDVDGVAIDASVNTEGLERLNVSIIDGDTDGDGDIDVLHSYGSRSFTIYDAAGNVVFDSGESFEQIIAERRPANAFNNDDYPSDNANVVDENRSDNKGPEPEAITVGEIDGHTLAFIGLERDSGIMIYDITNPAQARFLQYVEGQGNGNVSPEVVTFISAQDSGTGLPQIAVSYEISGTTALYDLAFGETLAGTEAAELLTGTAGGDLIFALGGDDVVLGLNGDDNLGGGAGDDQIWSGLGDDMAFGSDGDDNIGGAAGNDTLWGGRGEDSIWGGAGDDVIHGAAGGDLIGAGAGNDHITLQGGDTVWGGAGADLFEFVSGSNLLHDFDATSGDEQLDISAMQGIDDFADLAASHMAQIGTSVVILDDAGNALTLSNVAITDLDADDFLF